MNISSQDFQGTVKEVVFWSKIVSIFIITELAKWKFPQCFKSKLHNQFAKQKGSSM